MTEKVDPSDPVRALIDDTGEFCACSCPHTRAEINRLRAALQERDAAALAIEAQIPDAVAKAEAALLERIAETTKHTIDYLLGRRGATPYPDDAAALTPHLDRSTIEQAARLLRDWAGDRQRIQGKWTKHEQAAIECAIRLEAAALTPATPAVYEAGGQDVDHVRAADSAEGTKAGGVVSPAPVAVSLHGRDGAADPIAAHPLSQEVTSGLPPAEVSVLPPLLQRTTDEEEDTRQRATDVRGATGSPRMQPKGAEP